MLLLRGTRVTVVQHELSRRIRKYANIHGRMDELLPPSRGWLTLTGSSFFLASGMHCQSFPPPTRTTRGNSAARPLRDVKQTTLGRHSETILQKSLLRSTQSLLTCVGVPIGLDVVRVVVVDPSVAARSHH